MILRAYTREDSPIIAKWLRTETELYQWSADRYGFFPLLPYSIDDNYAPQMKTGRFIPLTGIDEQNVLLALYAQKNSKAKVITKVTRTNFRGIISKMDIGSVLFPQNMTSEAITAYVRGMNNSKNSGNIQTLYHMYDNRVEAVEFSVGSNSKVTGNRIMDLKLKNNLLVSFIERNGKVFLPSGESTIESGDSVVIVTTHPGLKEIDDILA